MAAELAMPPCAAGKARRPRQRGRNAARAALPVLRQRLAQRQVPLRAGAFAVGQQGGLGEGGQLPRQRDGGFAGATPGHDAVGQAHAQGLVGLDLAAGEDQIHGVTHADQARQAHGAAVDERNAEATAEDTKVGVLLHHAHVAPQGQLHAAGHRRAADGRDHRLGQLQPCRAHGADGVGVGGFEVELPEGGGLAAGLHAGAELQVPAGAEMAVGAVEHGDAGIGVILEIEEGGVQRLRGGCIDGVAHVRAVEGDDPDVVEVFDADGWHGAVGRSGWGRIRTRCTRPSRRTGACRRHRRMPCGSRPRASPGAGLRH
jgi:hypothetical protein